MPPEARRAAIIEATLPLLLERGAGISTRQIAEAAGIAEGTIFRVFPDKDAVVQAAIERARLIPGINAVSLTTGSSWDSARGLYESLGFVHYPERDWFVPNTDIELVVYAYSLQPRWIQPGSR